MALSLHAISSKHQVRVVKHPALALSLMIVDSTVQSDRCEPIISILDLPLEIQCEIFIHGHRDNSKNEPSRLPMEVVLSHVCSEWRNIAINLPPLWTAFKFDSHLHICDPVNKLEEYLCRSGTHLLELYFSFSASDYKYNLIWNHNFDRDLSLVKIAIAHGCRWHQFTLFADEFIPSFEFIDLFNEIYVPNLEYLALCLWDNWPPGNIGPLVFAGGAPKLSAVRIDATAPLHLPPPLSNITTLTILRTDNDIHFEIHIFHSILTIPTLANLSIETRSCPDPWIYGPQNFQMPSLKTLRISQDSNILGMLSSIDAPLLETLVLHNMDLTNVSMVQDIYSITEFIRLDTIALLDCHYLVGEDVNRVDMTLNALACRATHIIISSHGGPSFIENGSNILDFSQYGWARLQCITFDLSTSSRLAPYIKIFECSPPSITVRVVEPLLNQWARLPGGLTRLERVCQCKLETMKVGDLMMDEPWPAPGGLFEEDGNLKNPFIWGETFRAKGPDWILGE